MELMDPAIWTGKVYIDGWCPGSGGTQPVREPATGETLAEIGVATPQDVYRAADSAAVAQRAWAGLRPSERAGVLRRAGQLFEQHAAEISHWLTRESGSIAPKVAMELSVAAAECYEAAGLPGHPHGEVLTSEEDHWSFARRRPAGVVSVIAPFNVPIVLAIRSVAPALALGNAVLLKPDPRTSVAGGVALARVFEAAGLPAGVLQLLLGGGDVGAAVVDAPAVRVVSFTGSSAAGRRVGEAAARHFKRAHLELGGNNAMIVLPGADFSRAVSAGAAGSFTHQGQVCMATGRHLVHESLHERYVDSLATTADRLPLGNPATEDVALGPIIDKGQVAHIDGIVQETVAAGGRLAAGGSHHGLLYQPTVLADLEQHMPAWSEEIFGPVAPVLPFSSVEEAVDVVNASPYGLSVSILGDVGEAMKIADRVESGKVHINEMTIGDEAQAPFGGWKNSGNGARFGGAAANIEAFTETQWLTVRADIPQYPF